MSNFKDRLMVALHDAVGYFNDSHDPNDAVTKSASEHDFNAAQTTRLVETFNTARTIYHYKTASDRTVAFPLADADVVLPRLFGVVEASKVAAALPDYSWYDRRPVDQHETEKTADAPVPVESGLTLEALAAQAMKGLSVQRQLVKAANDEARVCGLMAASTLQKVANTLATGNADLAIERYARLMAAYGHDSDVGPVVHKLAEFIPKGYQISDAVMRQVKRAAVIDDTDLVPLVEAIKEAKSWLESEASLLAVCDTMTKEADDFEREYLEAISPMFRGPDTQSWTSMLHPELVKAALGDKKDSKSPKTNIVKRLAPLLDDAAVAATSLVKGAAGGQPGQPAKQPDGIDIFGEPISKDKDTKSAPKSDLGKGVASMLSDTVLEGAKKPVSDLISTGIDRVYTAPIEEQNRALSERLKNVQRSIMLQDLMTNDPVLSDETPDTVMNAYSAILQLAPEVASNKEIVRSILRQTVTSVAISPYDAELWTKLEGNIRGIRGKGATMQSKGGR